MTSEPHAPGFGGDPGRGPEPPGSDRRILLVVAGVVVVLVAALAAFLALRDNGTPGAGPTPSPGSTGPTRTPTGSGGADLTVPKFPGTPTASQKELLDQAVGFGSGVTGGAGGRIVRVDSDAESGAGSLRAAVQGEDPKWVVFDRDLTIDLTSPIAVGSNTTIDGRGHEVRLTGPGVSGLVLQSTENVVVESLTLHDFGDVTRTSRNDPDDAIRLDDATGVWIDHNDLSMAGDKLVALTNGASGVTVSWNHFHDQEQTFQVGNQSTAGSSAGSTLTVHHNFFDRDGYRMPSVAYGRAHVFNNYYLDWRLLAVRAERGGEIYLERNVFESDQGRPVVRTRPQGDGCNDAATRCDSRPGLLRSVDNVLEGDVRKIREASPDGVFDPRSVYAYDAKPATADLAAQVRAGAGPRS